MFFLIVLLATVENFFFFGPIEIRRWCWWEAVAVVAAGSRPKERVTERNPFVTCLYLGWPNRLPDFSRRPKSFFLL